MFFRILRLNLTSLLIFSFCFAKEGFYKTKSLYPKPMNFERLVSSTYKLNVVHSNWYGVGTAVSVSTNGYVLTALHNLIEEPELKPLITHKESILAKWYELDVIKKPIKLKGVTIENDNDRFEVELVSTGRGLQSEIDLSLISETCPEEIEDCYSYFFKKGLLGVNEDIALIKAVNPKRNFDCLRLKKNLPKTDSQVWAAGFPGPATREIGEIPDGDGLYFTTGVTYQSLPEYAVVVTSLDRNIGMSGGPVVDEKSRLIGVLIGGFGHSSNENYNDFTDITPHVNIPKVWDCPL